LAIHLNKSLPVIETENHAKRRSKDEVAYRALPLLVAAVKGEGLAQPDVERTDSDHLFLLLNKLAE